MKRIGYKLDFTEKKKQVFKLYDKYERLVQPYKSQAVCEKGCASCCIDVGSVGATTLEGLIILEYVQGWDRQALKEINRNLGENRNDKLSQAFTRCAFLDREQSCRIYAVRPFSCRRLYSMRQCDGQGAVVHRQAVMLGQKIEKELQELDPRWMLGTSGLYPSFAGEDWISRGLSAGELEYGKVQGYYRTV